MSPSTTQVLPGDLQTGPHASSPGGAPRKATYLPFLTGMRGVAAYAVAIRHLRGDLPLLESFEVLAVYAFFVLSAFLLTLRSLEKLPAGPSGRRRFWGSYAIRRVTRVYPLYFMVTALLAIATLAYPSLSGFLARDHGGFSFLAQASMVRPLRTLFWTVPLEMEFYLVVPFIVMLAARRPWHTVLACAGVSLAWSASHDPAATLYDPHLLSGALLPVFLAGSACGIIVHEVRGGAVPGPGWAAGVARAFHWVAGRTGIYVSVAALLLLLTPEARALLPGPTLFSGVTYRTMPVLVPALLLCALVVAGTLSRAPRDPFVRSLSTRAATRMGRISYSIYLTHPLAIALVLGVSTWLGDLSAGVDLLLFTLAAYGIASTTYVLVERPALSWGKRMSYRVSGGGLDDR